MYFGGAKMYGINLDLLRTFRFAEYNPHPASLGAPLPKRLWMPAGGTRESPGSVSPSKYQEK